MAVAGQGLLKKRVCAVKVHTPFSFAGFKVDLGCFFALTQCFIGHLIGLICHPSRELQYHPKNITKRSVLVHAERFVGQQLFLPEGLCINDLIVWKCLGQNLQH